MRWAPAVGRGRGRGRPKGVGGRGGQKEDLVVDCSSCLDFPPFWRSVCVNRERRGTTPGGRSQTRSLASHRPSPVTSTGGLPGGLRVRGTALPAPGLLRGDDTGWLLTAPGRASWLQSPFAAAWARSPASLAHTPAACVQPYSRSTFSFPLFFRCSGKSGFPF